MNIKESFGYIINSTARNMKKSLEEKIKGYDVTTSQWSVLKVLAEEDNLTQAQISEKLSADRATTGAVIEKLLNKKLINRNQCESDRRANSVSISDYGAELAFKISFEALKCNERALNGFKAEEIKQLLGYFDKINSNLNKE